jgi:hypothetical protein
MRTRFKLPSGTTGFYNDQNQWIATGSQMGLRDVLPEDRSKPIRLALIRLPFVDGCYDRWGAYWGSPANVWCAHADAVIVFVRADSRNQAKATVQKRIPGARWYR